MMELLKTCCKKLKILYRDIKYWFILKFDKSVFGIVFSQGYYKKGDVIMIKDTFYIVLKVNKKGENYDLRVSKL